MTRDSRIKYNVEKNFYDASCPGLLSNRHTNTSRELGIFESNRANDTLPDDESTQALIFNYWNRRIDLCHTCSQPLNVSRAFNNYPIMLTIRVAGMMTTIDQEILYEGVKYSIFAVDYRGFLHFIAWIRL